MSRKSIDVQEGCIHDPVGALTNMDDTRELKLERRDKSVARPGRRSTGGRAWDGICQAMRRAGNDPRAVAAAALDGDPRRP
jgi:hypothetical protein